MSGTALAILDRANGEGATGAQYDLLRLLDEHDWRCQILAVDPEQWGPGAEEHGLRGTIAPAATESVAAALSTHTFDVALLSSTRAAGEFGPLIRGLSPTTRIVVDARSAANGIEPALDEDIVKVDSSLKTLLDVLTSTVHQPATASVTPVDSDERWVAVEPYFDDAWYAATYPDARIGFDTPLAHYMSRGAAEGRSPNPLFHPAGYRYDNPDVANYADNPLLHYAFAGRNRGSSPHPMFDAGWYADRYGTEVSVAADPYAHYVSEGRLRRLSTSPGVVEGELPELLEPTFPDVADPELTIIVPVYGNFAYAYRCLVALSRSLPVTLRTRVVVADDRPQHPIRQLLEGIHGLHIRSNPTNLGFLRNCMAAAQEAASTYVLLLNSDTVPTSGWLEPLVRLAEKDPRIGLLGPKTLRPDRRLQDAGIIMFADAEGDQYGAGDDPNRPEYNYVRQVDCVIGSSLFVRRQAFLEVGGFDDQFQPAFFEEYDLAFAIRAAGYKVVYQPASTIYHHGAASYPVSVRDQQTAANRRKFAAKWAAQLTEQPSREAGISVGRERPHSSGTILVVDAEVPAPDTNAGALMTFQHLKLLVESDFKVIFLPHVRVLPEPYTFELQQLGVEVIDGRDFDAWLSENGPRLTHALLVRPNVAPDYVAALRAYSGIRILYQTVDLHFVRELRRYELTGDPEAMAESRRFERLEKGLFQAVDCVTTPSEAEAALISDLAPGKQVAVLSIHSYEPQDLVPLPGRPLRDRDALIFVGGFRHPPNVDAATYLVNEVMPLVWERIPGASVLIVGHGPPSEVRELASPRVIVTGHVPDLGPYYARARVAVSPLRYGAGLKGKVLSGLAAGVPTVTTTVGNEGLNLRNGTEALIGDTSEELAGCIVALFEEPDLLDKLARAGRDLITARFSVEVARKRLWAALDFFCCPVCGLRGPASAASATVCAKCGSGHVERMLAEVIIGPYRRHASLSLKEAIPYLALGNARFLLDNGPLRSALAPLGDPARATSQGDYDLVVDARGVVPTLGNSVAEAQALGSAGRLVVATPDPASAAEHAASLAEVGFETSVHGNVIEVRQPVQGDALNAGS